MKVTVDGLIYSGRPDEMLEFQKLRTLRQNEIAEAKLNHVVHPIPVTYVNEGKVESNPALRIEIFMNYIKEICENAGIEYLAQFKFNDQDFLHFQTNNMILDDATIYTQKLRLELKSDKKASK